MFMSLGVMGRILVCAVSHIDSLGRRASLLLLTFGIRYMFETMHWVWCGLCSISPDLRWWAYSFVSVCVKIGST